MEIEMPAAMPTNTDREAKPVMTKTNTNRSCHRQDMFHQDWGGDDGEVLDNEDERPQELLAAAGAVLSTTTSCGVDIIIRSPDVLGSMRIAEEFAALCPRSLWFNVLGGGDSFLLMDRSSDTVLLVWFLLLFRRRVLLVDVDANDDDPPSPPPVATPAAAGVVDDFEELDGEDVLLLLVATATTRVPTCSAAGALLVPRLLFLR
jgi:hypothetical protein